MNLSIVLPCYHPASGWEQRVIAAWDELKKLVNGEMELIIVDDGNGNYISSATIDLLKKTIPEFNWVSYEHNRGKGYALKQGVGLAKGEIIIYTDIDFPYTTDSFLEVYKTLASGAFDVAVGIKDEAYYHQVPQVRRIISKNLRWLIRTFLKMPITDTQCGLKGFVAKVKPVFLRNTIERYLFDLEFLHAVFNRNDALRVKAIPVTLNPGIIFRKMNYKILIPEVVNFTAILFRK
jgi:glycosyltransferase involved in cell wall biosynthesis